MFDDFFLILIFLFLNNGYEGVIVLVNRFQIIIVLIVLFFLFFLHLL